MQYVPTPNRGADVSSQGWEAGGGLLSGGGYQLNSYDSAKNFIFEWPSSSSPEAAQRMKSYSDGTYGRGLIYFVDPLTWRTNVLPPRWADPSMAIGDESATLIPGVVPVSTPTTGGEAMDLPVRSAVYDLSQTGPTDRDRLDDSNSVFIPMPEGTKLLLGAVYDVVGSGGVYCTRVTTGGALGLTSLIDPAPPEGDPATGLLTRVMEPAPGRIGVRVWVGRSGSTAGVLTLSALVARIVSVDEADFPRYVTGPWVGGQGHSGCRFIGKPTYTNETGVNGGQVSYAASFREVGSWTVG